MKYKNATMIVLGALTLGLSTAGSAATVTMDGVKKSGEYTGTNSGTESLQWWNGHHSIYGKDVYTSKTDNDLYWEINGSGSNYSLNLFVEVPTYARRMIWENGCNSTGTGCSLDQNYLDAYQLGTHHSNADMSYSTQTGSEFFELKDNDASIVKIKWTDEDAITDNFTWATSREYLISNNICTTSFCDEYDMTSSLELMWLGLASEQAALNLISSITDMELHLSDEARGLPPVSEVPIPAAAFLFAPALLGFMGFRRRAQNKAV